MSNDIQIIIKRILKDIKIDVLDEFDQNFIRQSFFSKSWARRKSPIRPGGQILINSGNLRRSIRSRINNSSIEFFSDLPYASIHNEGGDIVVTAKMKRFFWAKYYEASNSFGRKKDGGQRNDKRTNQLSSEAEFWKNMALMKIGAKIHIPQRQFLGSSPEIEKNVNEIIEENLHEYFKKDFNIKK